jgi:hypothetical protein
MASEERRKHISKIKYKDTKPKCLVEIYADNLDIFTIAFSAKISLAALMYVLSLSVRLFCQWMLLAWARLQERANAPQIKLHLLER